MKIIAHRGNSSDFIENSVSACRSALELACDAIEVDLQEVDGHYFVFHDRFLQRLTDHKGDIYDYQFHQMKAIHLNPKKIELSANAAICGEKTSKPVKEKIATLSNLFAIVSETNTLLNIELKGRMNIPLLLKNIEYLCHKYKFNIDNVLISAFNHEQLLLLRAINPNIKIGLLRHHQEPEITVLETIKPYSQHVELEAVTKALVEDIQAQGIFCFVYTVNYEDQFKYLKSIGVDGVFTDYPAQFIALNK
jgi:glycerophosphoryl diester phosphodiesterase